MTPYVEARTAETRNFENFTKLFKEHCDLEDPKGQASTELRYLVQGNLTVAEYDSTFRMHAAHLSYNDAALMDMYRGGLASYMFDELLRVQEDTSTFEKLSSVARKVDAKLIQGNLMRQLEAQRQSSLVRPIGHVPVQLPAPTVPLAYQQPWAAPSPGSGFTNFNHASAPFYVPQPAAPVIPRPPAAALPMPQSPALPPGVPMEVDPLRRAPGPRPPVAPEEMARRNANNLCRYCAQLGHYRINCPLLRSAQLKGWARSK